MNERNERIRQWINEAPEHELPEHDDLVMWGVFFDIGDDTDHPPDAVFREENAASEWADMVANGREYALLPCIVGLVTRDNVDAPV